MSIRRRRRLQPVDAPNEGAKLLRARALRTRWAYLEELTGINRDDLGRYARGVRRPAVSQRVSLEQLLGIPAGSWFIEVTR
jgi:hypothetical protein